MSCVPGLADRLRGDDADRVADLGHLSGGEEDAVAVAAHAVVAAALEHRAHRERRLVGLLAELVGDLLEQRRRHDVALGGELRLARLAGRERLHDVLAEHAAEGALVQPVRREHRELDEVLRLAVLLADDHVLGDVDETPRQVARVGRAERRVGEALAGAVGRDEVLEHRQALHEVGLDRALDDLALRIRHQAAHAGELADLLEGSTRSGVGHHVDRVERVERLLHRVGHLVGRLRPDVHDLLVALFLGDEAALVLLLDPLDPLLVAGEDLLLVLRDDDVVLRDRDPALGRVLEAERLDRVEHAGDRVRAVAVREGGDEVVRLALGERLVDELGRLELLAVLERLQQGALDLGVEDHAAGRGQDQLVVPAVLDRRLEPDLLRLDRELDLLLGLEARRTAA